MILIPRGFFMFFASRLAAVTLAGAMCWTVPAFAQQQQEPYPQQQPYPAQQPYAQPYAQPDAAPPPPAPPTRAQNTYGPDELVGAGHRFFGNVSRGLASVIERAVSQWGLPNGYVLGGEGR